MRPRRTALILAAIVLSGCSHGSTSAQPPAPAAADSAYTGLPAASPRALPVNASPAAAPSAPVVATSPAVSAPPPAPEPAPPPAPDLTAPLTTTMPAPAPVVADTAPPPAPAAPPAALETTPPSPSVPTPTPRPMDDNEAREEVVVLQTNLGNIVIELNDVAAPRTCGNFRKLVSTGFYNHTLFHRVIPHFMIQGGDPNSKGDDRRTYGLGDPGYSLPAEIKLRHVAGAVAMARLPDAANPNRDSNGSQFYICAQDCPNLDGQYTVFGQVIRGMETVNKIAAASRDKNNAPFDRIEIEASLETKQQALAESPQ